MLELAIRAAREAGAILQSYAARGFQISHKGRINLVTEADLASERHIKELITAHHQTHRVVAEESWAEDSLAAVIGAGAFAASDDYFWIIDPLDGTTNFSHNYPCYAVSIGVEHQGQMIVGVIYDPSRDELFAAERGAGAACNGERIHVSDVDSLERALLVSGFPYDVRERLDEYLPAWGEFLKRAQGVRRLGAAAIDMAYVANGRLDGFWEHGLNAWDTAAGWLIIEEAGGRVTKMDGTPFDNFTSSLLCTNGKIHDEMLDVLKELGRTS